MNPILEEFELNEKIDSVLTFDEIPYVFRDSKLKEEKLQKIEQTQIDLDNSSIDYAKKSRMRQKVYALRFILGLKEGNDYIQSLLAGGIGFVLGIATDEGLRNYVKNVAKEFLRDLPQYSKS
jgi:hypothetical protein